MFCEKSSVTHSSFVKLPIRADVVRNISFTLNEQTQVELRKQKLTTIVLAFYASNSHKFNANSGKPQGDYCSVR